MNMATPFAEKKINSNRLDRWMALILTLIGLVVCFSSKLSTLVTLWRTDPLRSIGVLMPLASLYFFYIKSKRIDWSQGTWWGLMPMAISVTWYWLMGEGAHFAGMISGHYLSISAAPTGVLLAVYLSGAVILFGGLAAWRMLTFPILLWLFVNPVPSIFAVFDFQLQTIAAMVARGFAHMISLPVEPGMLKMMFAPHLGMFIAPGCDGLRGMASMLCLSLIVGHHYQLTARRHLVFIAISVLLAYLMNWVRLCLVVIYYWFALRIDSISKLGTEIDYAMGGFVFFILAIFVFNYPRQFKTK